MPANFVGDGEFSLTVMIGVMLVLNGRAEAGFIQLRLSALPLLDDLIYKAIAVGFAFFTLATILGRFGHKKPAVTDGRAEFAAWLRMHLTQGWSGKPMAW